jgi:hypothetical protein
MYQLLRSFIVELCQLYVAVKWLGLGLRILKVLDLNLWRPGFNMYFI